MRVKTEVRRQAIVDVALEVFRECGFERSSMAMISRRLGGSKGTLYSYFKSKEDLFESAMRSACEGPGDQIMDLLDAGQDDLRVVLRAFAKAYLTFILGEQVLVITRTAISEGAATSLGPHLFEQGPGRALRKMESYFGKLIQDEKLREECPTVVSRHFKGLVEAGFLEQALYGAPILKDKAIDQAVDAFLRAYEPQICSGRTTGKRRLATTSWSRNNDPVNQQSHRAIQTGAANRSESNARRLPVSN